MPEPRESDPGWDETLDVICVGTSPGVLAYAICCAAEDLDVLIVHPPAEPDANTAQWVVAMTADLSPTLNPGRENTPPDRPGFSLARVAPAPIPAGKRVTLEPFVGEDLRQWSAACLESPFGVMFTQVPDLLVPMRTDAGESLTGAVIGRWRGGADMQTWLSDRADAVDLSRPRFTMTAMILDEGRIAGVELDDGSRIAATGGLAMPVRGRPVLPDLPRGDDDLDVAVVGRTGGRYARVDLFRR